MAGIDLNAALEVATAAALEAGALIRAEFHREGGPRHAGRHHAHVDLEAEHVIRPRLLEVLPGANYVGEETEPLVTSRSGPTWYVDPNDGTAAFIDGWRGSAVSIGLVVDGRPVLGVVYAPVAPDDAGDLITWAEGQPLRRNGREVQRPPLAATPHSTDVVLASQSADRSSRANAELCAPARFRHVPSIAYRLALVAVGEGEAGVSLNGPGALDVAGGHALLHAVGAELVDAQGRPVRYDGRIGSHAVFGGHVEVAKALAARDWARVMRREEWPAVGGLDLLQPSHRWKVADAGVLARAQGALLGQVAGDALGGLVEFQSPEKIQRRYPDGVRDLADGGCWNTIAGQPTDDSEMALALARTLARDGCVDQEALRASYVAWMRSGPFDIGGTTSNGLSGRPNPQSEANGALMRVSPLAVFGWQKPADVVADWARADASITHPNRVCGDASAVYAVALSRAVRTGESPSELYEATLEWARGAGLDPSVLQTFEASRTQRPADYVQSMGWVHIALGNAFFQLLHARDLEEALADTIGRGGDTDTNAAIAGALIGAVVGREGVPLRWRRAVLTCRPIANHQPRPRTFWPVDLLELAEVLAARGVE